MKQKFFCFRFDVDTNKCMKEGVPNLLKLGKETGARFTFFIVMGRSVCWSETIQRMLGKKQLRYKNNKNIDRFSALQKLGLRYYLIDAIINPPVGLGNVDIIRKIIREGHEFGLHGGINHAIWQNNAIQWSEERFHQELSEILRAIRDHNLPSPRGFTSPGFQGTKVLNKKLTEFGFQYVSDTYKIDASDKHEGIINTYKDVALPNIHVNITSGNGVSYIENLRARGYDTQAIIDDFEKHLRSIKQYAVVYEHPSYAGIKELETVKQMIEVAKSLQYKPVTLNELYEHSIARV